jgi:hypothetical protein
MKAIFLFFFILNLGFLKFGELYAQNSDLNNDDVVEVANPEEGNQFNGSISFLSAFPFFNNRINNDFNLFLEPLLHGHDQSFFAQIEIENYSEIISPKKTNIDTYRLIKINDDYKTLFYNKDPLIFTVHQVYIDYHFNIFDLRIGRQIISWGASDSPYSFINPNAVLTSYKPVQTFISPLKNSMIGKDAVQISFGNNVHQLEFIYIPLFISSKLMDYDNFWSPNLPSFQKDGNISPGGSLPLIHYNLHAITYSYENKQLFEQSIAARYKINIESIEMAVQYYYGIKDFPVFKTIQNFYGNNIDCTTSLSVCSGDVNQDITQIAVFPRFHNIGLSFLKNFEKLVVHSDLNYELIETVYENEKISNNITITGAPNSLLISNTITNNTHNINKFSGNIGIQYTPLNGDDLRIKLDTIVIYRAIDSNLTNIPKLTMFIIPEINWSIVSDKLSVFYLLISDFINKSYLHSIGIEYYPYDKLKINAGILFIHGKLESVYMGNDFNIGAYKDHNLIFSRFTFLF